MPAFTRVYVLWHFAGGAAVQNHHRAGIYDTEMALIITMVTQTLPTACLC